MKALPINNFRDVSGYRNADGQTMKKNRIFRGAALNHLTPEDAEYLNRELGIQYILDYRDEKEASAKPDVLCEGMEYHRISALKTSGESSGFDFGELLARKMTAEHLVFIRDYLLDGYRNMPFDNPAYHLLFDVLLRNDGNVYFHCSAGKDRTGISAFLIMLALDMSEEDAIREYLRSNQLLEGFVQEFYKAHPVAPEYRKYSDSILYVTEENIRTSIAAIREKYPTYREYLEKEYGIDDEKRARLKAIYCEP